MRALLSLVLLASCGRIDFDASPASSSDTGEALDYPAAVLASAPRLYYRLGETTGSVVHDASGNGHDNGYGAQAGAFLELGQPGALSRADDGAFGLVGDGNAGPGGDCGVTVDPAAMDWSGDFTVELFAKPHLRPVPSYTNTLFICENYLVDGFRLGWTRTDTIEAWVFQGGGTAALDPPQTVEYDVYMHVVLVRRGTMFELYRNGLLLGTQDMDYIPVSAAAECGLGAFHGMPTDGTFDELALYDRALDLGEIQSHVSAR